MHAGRGGGADIEALDVDLPTGEDGCYLVEDAREVLRVDDERVERQSLVAEQCTFVSGHGGTRHGVALEGLLLAALRGVLRQGGTALPCQVLLEAVALDGRSSQHCLVEALYLLLLLHLVALAARIAVAAFSVSCFLICLHNYELCTRN